MSQLVRSSSADSMDGGAPLYSTNQPAESPVNTPADAPEDVPESSTAVVLYHDDPPSPETGDDFIRERTRPTLRPVPPPLPVDLTEMAGAIIDGEEAEDVQAVREHEYLENMHQIMATRQAVFAAADAADANASANANPDTSQDEQLAAILQAEGFAEDDQNEEEEAAFALAMRESRDQFLREQAASADTPTAPPPAPSPAPTPPASNLRECGHPDQFEYPGQYGPQNLPACVNCRFQQRNQVDIPTARAEMQRLQDIRDNITREMEDLDFNIAELYQYQMNIKEDELACGTRCMAIDDLQAAYNQQWQRLPVNSRGPLLNLYQEQMDDTAFYRNFQRTRRLANPPTPPATTPPAPTGHRDPPRERPAVNMPLNRGFALLLRNGLRAGDLLHEPIGVQIHRAGPHPRVLGLQETDRPMGFVEPEEYQPPAEATTESQEPASQSPAPPLLDIGVSEPPATPATANQSENAALLQGLIMLEDDNSASRPPKRARDEDDDGR